MFRVRPRQAVILLTSAIAVAYLTYRALFTLNLTTTYATFASVLLYAGELYGVMNMLLYFVQVWDVYEPPQQPVLEGRTVDVFVPTYNEDPDLLRMTLRACVAMDYPHTTYLCDDGGTEARCNDPEKGPAARERAEKLKAMCEELGVVYTTRPKNNHAKAGNLNYAFEKTEGEFLIIFDADHVPEPHFITRLIGYFADEKLAFVQTPHAFYNFDSFQARLNHASRRYWEEGQLFYHVIQPGRNRCGCPIFAGSAAMFRRSALKEVGYIATETITEDMHTGLRMHSRGWKSLGISERMVAGQAAQDVTTFHSQRLRWGEGNLSVIFYDNPLTMRGLTMGQRLCYAATVLNWASGLFKLAIYLTPLLMLITGVPPVSQFTWGLAIMMGVYMAACILGTKVAGNGYGSFWYSELFTMASFWTQVRGTMKALFWRKFQQFIVTAKRGRQSKSIWPYIRPQVYLIVFSALALLWAWSRLAMGISDDPYKPMLATFWAGLHMLLAYVVVRRAFWPDDRRYSTRHTVFIPATFKGTETGSPQRALGFTSDLNDQGMTLIAYQKLALGELAHIALHAPGQSLTMVGRVKSVRKLSPGEAGVEAAGGFRHGIQFEERTTALVDALNTVCLHFAVPRLYRYYMEGHRPLARKVAGWIARRIHSKRVAERREYNLPLYLFPVGSPERACYAITEDVSRSSMAVLIHAPVETGAEIRYAMTSPLGEIAGTGLVLRCDRYELAARPFYRTVIEFDRFDDEGRQSILELFEPAVHRRLKGVLRPAKAPMPIPINRPLVRGAAALAVVLACEFGVFRLFYRDDFFLNEVAAAERTLDASERERLDRVYRDTMRMSWPSTDRLVLLAQAMAKSDRPAELAEVTRRLAPRDPGNADLQIALAHARDQSEDFEQAEADFRRLLAEVDAGKLPESRREELLAGLARAIAHYGDPDAAAREYRNLIAAFPAKMAYRHELAGQLLSARRYKEAASVYDGVDPGYEGRVMLVLIHTGAKDAPAAEREARALLKERPDDPAAQGLLADVLNARGDFRQAKVIYERLLRSGQDERRIAIQMAHASLWAKEYDEALERFQAIFDRAGDVDAIVQQYPQVPRAYLNSAASAEKLGEPQRQTALALFASAGKELGGDSVYLARLGWVLHRLEEFDKSALLLDQALTLNPADQGLRMQLAGVLVSAGRPEEALRLLGDGASTVEARMLLVDVYMAAKNFAEAEKVCRELVAANPSPRDARIKLANVLSWKGDYAESLRLFEELRKETPDDLEIQIRLAEVTLWSGDRAGALKRYRDILAADFDRPFLWYGFADAAAGVKNIDAEDVRLVRSIADRVLAGEHRTARAIAEARKTGRTLNEVPFLTRLGWLLLDRLKDRAAADAVLALIRSPGEASPAERKELSGVFAAAGRYEEALRLYDGLALDVKDLVTVARIRAALTQFAAAADNCREALKRSPLDRDARRTLADVLSWDGRFREALQEFDSLAESNPSDRDVQRRRAEVMLWSGDVSRALEAFTALVKEQPAEALLWPGFLDAAARTEKLGEEQLRFAEQILARPALNDATEAGLLLQAAQVAFKHVNDKPRARELLNRAHALGGKDAVLLTRLAWAMHQSGDAAGAAAVLEGVLAARPTQPGPLRELAGVLTATGRYKEARGIYADLLKAAPADREIETRLAETMLWGGDPISAIPLLASALEGDLRQPDLLRLFVEAAAAAPRLGDAQLKLAMRIAAAPPPALNRDDLALFASRLGWALHREGTRLGDKATLDASSKLLDKVAAGAPESLKAKAEAAGVLAATGRWKEAMPWLEEVAAARPDDAEAQRQLAVAALNAGNYEQALLRLQKLLEAEFERPALWGSFVDAAAGLKGAAMTPEQLALAVKLARKAAPEAVADPGLYYSRLAWALLREGRSEEAAPVLDRALAAEPKDAKARREIAGILTAAGRYKEALVRLEKLGAASPGDFDLQGRIAEVALWGGDRALALTRLTKLLSAKFDLPQFWTSFVDAAAALNKGELTPEQLRLAIQIAEHPVPESVTEPAQYRSRLGWTLFREGRPKLAEPLLDKAAAEPPANPKARRELGGVLTAAGKYAEALKVYEGLELTVDDRLALVVLHAAAKQFNRAEEQCRLVLKERPDDLKARRWLADVSTWSGQYQRALALYEELLAADVNQPELWPGFAESATNVAALPEAQARIVLAIASRPDLIRGDDAVFLARMGLLLFRDAEGRDALPRLAGTVLGDLVFPGGAWQAAAAVAGSRGRQVRAAALLERAFEVRPKDPTLLARLAFTLFRAGLEGRCERLLGEAVAMKPREPAVRREVGDVFVAIGRSREALAWFEALAADVPSDVELQARLAEVTVWAGDYAKGLSRLEALLRDDIKQPRLWRPFADAASAAGSLSAAQNSLLLRIADQSVPDGWSVSERALYYSRLAWSLFREGERTGAGELISHANRLLDAAIALKPEERKVREELAGVLAAARRYRETLVLIEEMRRETPDDPALRVLFAKVVLESGRHADALVLLEELLTADFRQPNLWRPYAEAAGGVKVLTRSQRDILAMVARQPGAPLPESSVYLANLALTLRREALAGSDAALLREAEALLDRALAHPPASARQKLDLAGILSGAGRVKEALELARAVTATDAAGRALLADIRAAAGDLAGAELEARELVRLKPDDWEARFKLASILGWNRKYADATELYRLLAAERPDDPRIPLRLAQVSLWGGDYDDALERYRRILESGSRGSEVVTGYIDAAASARVWKGEANNKAALVAFEELRVQLPSDAVALGRLAWVLTRAEEHARSAQVLQRALELAPNSREYRLRLARALTEAGQFTEADKHYRLLLRTAPDRGP